MLPCVFLDRDGVLNKERGDYTFKIEDFEIPDGTVEALQRLKKAGFLLIVVTNQAGIAKKLYTESDVWQCHAFLQEQCNYSLDDLYFCPYYPDFTSSLARKPDTLMLEKAVAKYQIDISKSWMIGDSLRDIIAGQKMKLKTIQVNNKDSQADFFAKNLYEASEIILNDANLEPLL